LIDHLDGKPSNPAGAASMALGGDESLGRLLRSHRGIAEVLAWLHQQPALRTIASTVQMKLADPPARAALIEGLRASPARATALEGLERVAAAIDLLDAGWRRKFLSNVRNGAPALPDSEALGGRVETLEQVLGVRETRDQLPPAEAEAIRRIAITPGIDPMLARSSLTRDVLAAEITRRLTTDPALRQVDPTRLNDAFTRIRQLESRKRELVRDQILLRWVGLQQSRLLARTGSRLNPLGADMRRRLMLRGERALRLRQVVAMGNAGKESDPLFDLRPVWMASPETVAQVFPRLPLFDVVVFDEASQLRLEESLPVLVRGRRVVIAGDPKQLPPTRFFESAVATSEDESIETEQDLFEAQQSSVEDLLGAALNLSIQQSYLDVHYRSKTAELIEFSNRHFYGSRLQAVPTHPSRRRPVPAITLYEVGGTYVDRSNEIEADKVVEIVADLLARANPPSIGIACFNLVQRDLIVDKLDTRAADIPAFAKRLAEARERVGDGSFEGLFVKNLENVQGDERDHMIISTTYGPDPAGRFRRTFGPLGQAGGARRLNVLVTRAREQIHLVTSIPAQHYTALPPIPEGQTAGGGWLLFAYIHFAASLRDRYAPRDPATSVPSSPAAASSQPSIPMIPSAVVDALAAQLNATSALRAEAYWGNAGFGIDLAVHPASGDVSRTLGVLCDLSRFPGAGDPVEWEVFRNGIHEAQGWTLQRVWSPQLFRDPPAILKSIESAL
ncbi:MAG TPA: AAA domain-containing protein, partial [Tepidisphaeraceae bacterium]|nr:AAA domain-containing protein [Tepidisphaeraceae bacterium]